MLFFTIKHTRCLMIVILRVFLHSIKKKTPFLLLYIVSENAGSAFLQIISIYIIQRDEVSKRVEVVVNE